MPLVLFLLACAVVYLGTVQAAFSALMRLSLRLVAERNNPADLLGRFLDAPPLLFVPVRLYLGVSAVCVVIVLGEMIGIDTPHRALAVIVAAGVLLVVCEHLIPTLIVRKGPEPVLDVLLPSFAPVARAAHLLTALLLRLEAQPRERNGAPTDDDAHEQQGEAAQAYLEAGEQEGLIESDERRLIQSIVEFGDTLVREVMTPRPDVVAIRAEASLADLRTLLKEQTYSRIPVFSESLDNIQGIVFVKDLILLTEADRRELSTLMRPAHFVPETKKVSDLLKEFQRQRVQIAVVVDEYGGTAGLVTLEDLIEEIVGEIRDEYDEESEPITDEGHGEFVFSGKVSIDELGESLGVEIPREGFETVGGYVLARLGRVPTVGETFEIDDLAVEVVEAERRRVTKVRVRRRAADPRQEEART
jgi:putative hemolysin